MVAASSGSLSSQTLWNSLDCCKSSINWSSHAAPAAAHSHIFFAQPKPPCFFGAAAAQPFSLYSASWELKPSRSLDEAKPQPLCMLYACCMHE